MQFQAALVNMQHLAVEPLEVSFGFSTFST
jgi:hypothetical protein